MEHIKRAAVFLDRDGTINVRAADHEYITDPAALELLPGAVHAMIRLTQAGWPLIVISNQRGIARGLLDFGVLHEIEALIQAQLETPIEAFYYCPHAGGDCDCRKPAPGMLLTAAREHDIDLTRSWMVGDADSDAQAGQAAGTRTLQLGVDVADLDAAATEILRMG